MTRSILLKGFPAELDVYQQLQSSGLQLELVAQSGRYQPQLHCDLLVAGFHLEVKYRRDGFKLLRRWLDQADILWLKTLRAEDLVVLRSPVLVSLLRPPEDPNGLD